MTELTAMTANKLNLIILAAVLLIGCQQSDNWHNAYKDAPNTAKPTDYVTCYILQGYDQTTYDGDTVNYTISVHVMDVLTWWPNSGGDTGGVTHNSKFTQCTVTHWREMPQPPEGFKQNTTR
jgi:hypothetical protein